VNVATQGFCNSKSRMSTSNWKIGHELSQSRLPLLFYHILIYFQESVPAIMHLSPTKVTFPSRYYLRAVVPKAMVLVESTRGRPAFRSVSRDDKFCAIIRRLVGAGVKREMTSCRRFQYLDGSARSFVCLLETCHHFVSV
jgi:hypothetical protein